jgi:4'-phosphopantetheinyl transferase
MSSRSPDAGDVHAWYAPVSDLSVAGAIDAALAWLTPEERERYARFRADADRHMFLLGRAMARVLVGRALGIAPTAWQWREGPHGRPEVASPDTRLQFNIAHSAGLVACAVAVGRDVGVDVEDLERRPVEWGVVQRHCGADEILDITAQGGCWHERFLHYWTLKEAYLKALGLGIAAPLAHVGFRLDGGRPRLVFTGSLAGSDTRWQFRLDRPTGRHLLAVAASNANGVEPAIHVQRLTEYLL